MPGPSVSPSVYGGGMIGMIDPERKLSAPQSRIDPSGIPRPRYNLETEPYVYNGKDGASAASGAALPPPAYSFFIATDTGNCSPRFMRSTLYQLPISSSLLSECKVPLALLINPLAEVGERDSTVPVVDFGGDGPIRCGRCKAYINPYSKFRDAGAAYTCNMCGMVNQGVYVRARACVRVRVGVCVCASVVIPPSSHVCV